MSDKLEKIAEALIAGKVDQTVDLTRQALEELSKLRGCEAHLTHMPPQGDETGFRNLGVNLTTDPVFASEDLYSG
jgi:uncharacterized protein (UPF0371 family)